MTRPRTARLLSLLVAALVAAGVVADVPPAQATDHGLTTFSAPLGVAPDPQNPGIYKGTVIIGWHANDPCKHWEFNISGTVPAFVQGSGSSTQQTATAVALLQAGQTVTVTGSVLCRFGSLDMPLTSFPTVTLTAPPGPPTLPSQLSQDQKNALNKSAAQAALIAASLAAAGLIVAAIVCPPCALIGAFLGAAGAGAGIVSAYKWLQSADPPDAAYTSVEQPRVVIMPVMAAGPGISDALAAAMNTALKDIADQISLSRAFLVALQREWGAQVAGDGTWETNQAIAVRDFATRLADAMARQSSLMHNVYDLIEAIPSSGLPADVAPSVSSAIAAVLVNPLPAVAATLSAQSGQTADELALMGQRNRVLTLGLETMHGKATAPLVADDGSSDAVAALRALAAVGLPPPGPSKLPMPAPGRSGNGALKSGPCLTTVARKGCTVGTGISGAAFSTISADGRSMYVSGRNEASIGVFRRDAVTGALVQLKGKKGCVHDLSVSAVTGCTPGHALAGVSQLAVSRDGKSLIAAARGSNAISVYKRSVKDGSLTWLQCFRDARSIGDPHCKQVVGLGDSQSVAISGDGRSVYATGGSTSTLVSFARNPKTSKLAPKGCLTSSSSASYASCASAHVLDGANRLLLSPNGLRLFVAAESSGAVSDYARDPHTGALHLLGCIGGDDNFVDAACAAGRAIRAPQSLTLSPDGHQLYATVTQGIAVMVVDPVTGELSQPAGTAGCLSFNENHDPDCTVASALDGAFGIALAPDGHEAYVGSYSSNAVTQYTRDTLTGALTPISRCVSLDAAGCQRLAGLEHAGWVTMSPDGRFVYVNAPYSNAVVRFARRLPLAIPSVVKPKVTAAHGVVKVTFACPKAAYGGCYGTVSATHGSKVGRAVAYSVTAGKRAVVRVPVPAGWRTGTGLLVNAREPAGGKRKGRLRLKVT